MQSHQLSPDAGVFPIQGVPSPTARPFSSACHRWRRGIPLPCPARPLPRCPGSADRLMTQPARRPTTPTATAETVFLGASSIPDPRPSPATPLPDIPFLHASAPPPPPPPVPLPQKQKQGKYRSRPGRLIRSVRAAFRSFPIIPAPSCRGMPSLHHLPGLHGPGGYVRNHFHGATRATGTLYGHRRARITIAFHDSPASPPGLLLDIAVPTAKFIQDVSAAGMVRVTLECDKQQHHAAEASRRLLDEPLWAAEVNGESVGYAARREATEQDERVMQLLHATSMGAGVLPADMAHPADGELTYMRAHFDRVVGSKDAETYYMHNPEGSAAGPELTIFFIRT
ncbi:uncharacterized protein LOC133931120 [Phragmites australis]|uniref:uncharacterized protein LOC133931120 n=1 Tax=Phragmites australis TaxID=29695 RepID=UPI002D764C78|nr:uncharacterized protein LOC133931120 [Phragmites australis]